MKERWSSAEWLASLQSSRSSSSWGRAGFLKPLGLLPLCHLHPMRCWVLSSDAGPGASGRGLCGAPRVVTSGRQLPVWGPSSQDPTTQPIAWPSAVPDAPQLTRSLLNQRWGLCSHRSLVATQGGSGGMARAAGDKTVYLSPGLCLLHSFQVPTPVLPAKALQPAGPSRVQDTPERTLPCSGQGR